MISRCRLLQIYDNLKEAEAADALEKAEPHLVDDLSEQGTKSVIEFTATRLSVKENEGKVKVNIIRYGKMNQRVIFK